MATTTTNPPAVLEWPAQGVAMLRLTRGDTHNTITDELLAALDRLLDEAAQAKARALVVTGSGRTFCGGAAIRLFTDPRAPLHRNARAVRDDYVVGILRTFRKLRELPFPTVAAINGHALGGGCELALTCDFRLMAETARIGLTETRLGALAGGGGVQQLGRIVGRARALEISLLGEQVEAHEALAVGLVRSVHGPEDLEEAALAFARRFLACSPVSVAETKRALYRCETAQADEADRIALDAVLAAAAGEEWWEGMTAFTERRAPAFGKEG
jgi:enoyl-CoA hydratase/carnithine racemase